MYISNPKSGKVFLIMDDFATHSLEHVGRGESFGFQPCS